MCNHDHTTRHSDILLSRRGVIVCAAGLIVARPAEALAGLTATPEQTPGPFYPQKKPRDSDFDLTQVEGFPRRAEGEVIEVEGRVLGITGRPLEGTRVEIWQADAQGRYHTRLDTASHVADPGFQGFGAVATAADGAYRFRTIRPASYGEGRFLRTPHIHFRIIDGRRRTLTTQMYFPGEPLNGRDAIYSALSGAAAKAAATARAAGAGAGGVPRLLFEVVMG
jgi:protocatechuate 3,4-dioxygenase beta subunit